MCYYFCWNTHTRIHTLPICISKRGYFLKEDLTLKSSATFNVAHIIHSSKGPLEDIEAQFNKGLLALPLTKIYAQPPPQRVVTLTDHAELYPLISVSLSRERRTPALLFFFSLISSKMALVLMGVVTQLWKFAKSDYASMKFGLILSNLCNRRWRAMMVCIGILPYRISCIDNNLPPGALHHLENVESFFTVILFGSVCAYAKHFIPVDYRETMKSTIGVHIQMEYSSPQLLESIFCCVSLLHLDTCYWAESGTSTLWHV